MAYGKRQESIKIYVDPRRYVRVRDGGVSRYGSSRLKTIYSQSLALGESTLEVIVSSSLVWYSGSRRIVEPRMTPLRLCHAADGRARLHLDCTLGTILAVSASIISGGGWPL